MNNLRTLRKKYKMTAAELANKLGVSKQAVCAWERGDKEIPPDRKKEIMEIFDLYGEPLNKTDYDFNGVKIETVQSRVEEDRFERMLAYQTNMTGIGLDEIFRKRKESQKKLEEEIHKSFDGPNYLPISKQIIYMERGMLIYSHFLKIIEKIYEKPLHEQAAYFNVIMEALYAFEKNIEIDSSAEIEEMPEFFNLKSERINFMTETFKVVLEHLINGIDVAKDVKSFTGEKAKTKDGVKGNGTGKKRSNKRKGAN